MMIGLIPLVLTLKKWCRTPEISRQVQEIASELGLEISGVGVATLSCRVIPSTFDNLFKQQVKVIPRQLPTQSDYGTASGYEGKDLPIPIELVQYLDYIAIMPTAKQLYTRQQFTQKVL